MNEINTNNNIDIINSKGELDADKLADSLDDINKQIIILESESRNVVNMPTKVRKGVFSKQIDSKKIDMIATNAYYQAILTKKLMDTQFKAIEISLGSYKAIDTVNKELTKVINKHISNSDQNSNICFEKTRDQIRRIATFTKSYADQLKEVEFQLETKISELTTKIDTQKENIKNEISQTLKKYATIDDIDNSHKLLQNIYVNKSDYESYKQEHLSDFRKINELETNYNQINNSYATRKDCDELDDKIKNLNTIFEQLNRNLQSTYASKEKFDKLEDKIYPYDKDIQEIKQKLEKQNYDLQKLNSTTEEQKESITELKKFKNSMEEKETEINKILENNNANFEALNGLVDSIPATYALQSNFETLNNIVDSIPNTYVLKNELKNELDNKTNELLSKFENLTKNQETKNYSINNSTVNRNEFDELKKKNKTTRIISIISLSYIIITTVFSIISNFIM